MGGTQRDGEDGRSDEELVAAVAGGDRGALAALHQRHAPWLVLRLSRRCADPALVDEVVQDTFVAVWRGAARYRASGAVGAWMWGIAVRRLVDALRRTPRTFLGRHPAAIDVSAEDTVLLGIEHGRLGPALDQLSPELRAVVQATVLDGLTTREAGRLLDIPAGTVKTRMMRARAQLREALT